MKAQRQVLRAIGLTMLAVVLAASSVLPSGLVLAQQDERIAVAQAAMTALQAQLPLPEGSHYVAVAVNIDGDWGVARFQIYQASDNTPTFPEPTDPVLAHREGGAWQAATIADPRYPDWLVAVPTTLVSQEEKDRLLEELGVTPDPTATPLPTETATPLPTDTPKACACYTWQVGNRVGIKGGTEIRGGPSFSYPPYNIPPIPDDWQVDIIGGPRYADGEEWWDISRKQVDGGGTGWVYIAQAGYNICEPGCLELVDDLSLRSESGAWPPQVRDKLIAHIKVRNVCGQSLHVEHIGVRGRRNGSENWDIGFWTIDLGGGQEWSLDPNNERALEEGSYSFRISYSLDGKTWKEIGNEINFTVQPSEGCLELVDDLSLRSESGAWPPQVRDKLIAHIKVRNVCGQSLHVEHIGVRGRRNRSENWDIGFWTIDLGGGQEWSLDPNNERALEEGSYSFRISYSLDGKTWKEIGNEINFTVQPSEECLELVDDLSLRSESGAWPPQVRDKLIAHIKVRNVCGQSLHVEHIGVRGRRNGSENWDIGFWTIDLGGGQEWSLDPNNERALEEGSYSFRISYSLDGKTWKEIGNEINFTVSPDLYSISGRITDGSGNPISGVTVSAGAGGSAITDANGDYTITGLVAGTYPLTPSKIGWTFTPATRTVSVPPSATGQDFTGEPIDIGFRPNPDGYQFCNGPTLPHRDCDHGWGWYPLISTDYSIDEATQMFGEDAVCNMIGGVCFPKFGAIKWIANVNWYMNGGHCDGMASTSLRFFKGLDNPADFQGGANTTHDLDLGNARRHIAYYHVVQFTEPMKNYLWQVRQENTPADILDQLSEAMSGSDLPTLGVYGDVGHVIVPYAIEDRGSGVYWVKVYDNNYPDDANWHVEINTTNDTWSYNLGSETWSGDANTHSLDFAPVSKYAEQPDCPWGSGITALSGSSSGQVWLTGQGHLLITDAQGRRIGYVGDQFVNEVPNAYESIFRGGLGVEMEPVYTLPLSDTHTILLDGQTLTQMETAGVTQFGPGHAAWVDDMTLGPASQDQLTIAPDGTQLAYQSSSDQEVTLALALDSASESNQLQVNGADVGAGQVVVLTADVGDGQLVFNNAQAGGGKYDLDVGRISAAGKQMFAHTGLAISATDTHYVDYGAWDGSGPMTLHVDHGSDGTIDKTLVLPNQTPIEPVSGTVKLQGRKDHSGTAIFLSEELCPSSSAIGAAVVIPGPPSTTTDDQGRFEIIPYPGGSYQCLQAIQRGYLVGQKDLPQGNLGEITLLGGDATEDDLINIFDLALIAGRYKSNDPTADVNGDGKVDIFDLALAASNYGQRGPQTGWQ